MSAFQFICLPLDFKVEVISERVIDDEAICDQVEKIWNSELKERMGKLENQLIASFVSIKENVVVVEMVEYKFYLATLREPLLQGKLQIKPLSISGFTHASDMMLVGKRSLQVSQYPGFYEFVPSGSVDESHRLGDVINIKAHVLQELYEEALIASNAVLNLGPFLLVYEKEAGIYEIVVKIRIEKSRIYVGKWDTSGEYQSLMWLTKEQLEEHLAINHAKYVPLSKQIFSRFIREI